MRRGELMRDADTAVQLHRVLPDETTGLTDDGFGARDRFGAGCRVRIVHRHSGFQRH